MKVSIKWLKEFVDFSLNPAELADALTMAGLEVEDIIPDSRDKGDSILEISVTPNRPDCLSIRGIAHEISAILKLPFKDKSASVEKEEGVRPLIEIKEPDLCPRYASRIIHGIKVKPSPEWIAKRIESHGFRPANNIVDITNYVLLEMGHPMHAFDLDKLESNMIVVKTAGSVKKFQTLDSEERTLSQDMLLIWDAKNPVAIAGVMGGLNTEISPSTVNVLLESAYFDPLSIRRTSKALNLSTEASYRFERGTDIKRLVPALDRATQLIIEIAGGKTTRTTDVYVKPFSPVNISVDFKKINNILGTDIKPSTVQELLTGLGLENKAKGPVITVSPPSFRQDIQRNVDVIEEIARLYGYDKIPATLPAVTMQPVNENTKWTLIKTVKDSIRKSGYSEAINYSFLNPLTLDKLRLPPEDTRRNLVKIRNPLRKEEEALRTTLIPALLDNLRLNINRGERSLRFFEISRVFSQSQDQSPKSLGSAGQKLPEEVLKMAAVYLKDSGPFLWQDRQDGFYDLKGALEGLLQELKIKNYSFIQDTSISEPFLHPGKSCFIKIGNQTIGVTGTLHPDVAQSFDVPTETSLSELDISRLLSCIPSKTTYTPLPKYPYIERDLAIIVSEDITTAQVEDVILKVNSDLIESIKLFDIYSGKPIPHGKKSLAFSIRYRVGDRTLTDNEVNQLHAKIVSELENSLKAELRS